MAATYTLHVPRESVPGDAAALDRAVVIRDGFAWGAFLVPMLYFFWHRHLVAGILALLVVIGLAAAMVWLGANLESIAAAEIVLHLLFGFEGASLRRWINERRGRPSVDLVVASDRTEAEAKSFGMWLDSTPVGRPRGSDFRVVTPARGRADEPVIGLFPDVEGRG